MNKKALSESDICDRYISSALKSAGWDNTMWRREFRFTDGGIIVRNKLAARGKSKRADYSLFLKPNPPIAVIEAKDNNHSLGAGMQQDLGYATSLDVPFGFSSNGDEFLFHDRTGTLGKVEQQLGLNEFPAPETVCISSVRSQSPLPGTLLHRTLGTFSDSAGYYPEVQPNNPSWVPNFNHGLNAC